MHRESLSIYNIIFFRIIYIKKISSHRFNVYMVIEARMRFSNVLIIIIIHYQLQFFIKISAPSMETKTFFSFRIQKNSKTIPNMTTFPKRTALLHLMQKLCYKYFFYAAAAHTSHFSFYHSRDIVQDECI